MSSVGVVVRVDIEVSTFPSICVVLGEFVNRFCDSLMNSEHLVHLVRLLTGGLKFGQVPSG